MFQSSSLCFPARSGGQLQPEAHHARLLGKGLGLLACGVLGHPPAEEKSVRRQSVRFSKAGLVTPGSESFSSGFFTTGPSWQGSSPGPWARRLGPGLVPLALGSSPGPWARRLGPGLGALALGSSPGPWARRLGPGLVACAPWARRPGLVACGPWARRLGPAWALGSSP